jgi:hypothetical protein
MKFHDFVLVNTDFYINEKAYVIDRQISHFKSSQYDRDMVEYLVQFYNYNYRRWINEEYLTKTEL